MISVSPEGSLPGSPHNPHLSLTGAGCLVSVLLARLILYFIGPVMFHAPRKFKIKYKNIEVFERQIVDHTATTESCRDVTYRKDTCKDEPLVILCTSGSGFFGDSRYNKS